MTDAPERIWLDWPDANRGGIVYDEPPERDTQPGQTAYLRAEIAAARVDALQAEVARLRAKLDEARQALNYYVEVLCEGFCEDMPDRGYTDANCEIDCTACKARAALAHISEKDTAP